jgi:hypothetical protein
MIIKNLHAHLSLRRIYLGCSIKECKDINYGIQDQTTHKDGPICIEPQKKKEENNLKAYFKVNKAEILPE